jgi:hypothetical protein
MSEKLWRFQARARELARSGKFHGWRPIAFTLQFEEGFAEAFQWVYDASTKAELDSICREAGPAVRLNTGLAEEVAGGGGIEILVGELPIPAINYDPSPWHN